MRVGLMADSHDRLPAIRELVVRLQAAGVGFVLHAGDFCSPFSLRPFIDAHMAVAGVFGRNDGDPEGLRAKAAQAMGIELYESPHSFSLGDRRILLVHDIGEVNERSIEEHAIVITGCSHQRGEERRGDVLVVNPGEACGWLYGVPSAAILDLETLKVEWVTLDDAKWKG
jgi:putative phosphoesterase